MTDSLSAIPAHYPYPFDFNTAERYVLLALNEELNSITIPVTTEEEADFLWKTVVNTNSGNSIFPPASYLALTNIYF